MLHRDDLRTRSGAAGSPDGGMGRNSRERREDGADDRSNEQANSRVRAGGLPGGSTVSARHSRVKVKPDRLEGWFSWRVLDKPKLGLHIAPVEKTINLLPV